MKNFKREKRGGDRKNFGRGDRDRDNFEHKMFKTTCFECGKSCEVPFKPSGDKPVYCNDCFGGKNRDNSRNNRRRDFGRGDRSEKKMFSAICDECGQTCELPFKPSSDKPVYCSDCFKGKGGDGGNRGNGNNKQLEEQLKSINIKLDKLIKALIPTVVPTIHIIDEKIIKKNQKEPKPKREVKPVKEKKKVPAKKADAKKKKK